MHRDLDTDAQPPADATGDGGKDEDEPSKPEVRSGLIPRKLLDDRAVFVVRRLQQSGHEAYLVGGCVRDLLSGLEPKDFDVATDARPNRIKRLFRSARVIGRRFRLAHILFPGNYIVETATFRGDPDKHDAKDVDADASYGRRGDWRHSVENIFGTAPEDANRRDFTINALFYDPVADEVIDWVGGLADVDAGVVRCIGVPEVRIDEDPVRMLRAVHFAHRMDFEIEPSLETSIREHAALLERASQARLYIELTKILGRGSARETMRALWDLGVLDHWLPELCAYLDEPAEWPRRGGGTHEEASKGEPVTTTVAHATWNLLGAADRWGLAAHEAPDALALAVLFGPWLIETWRRAPGQGFNAFHDHVEETFRPVAQRMSIPRAVSARLREMLWLLGSLRDPPNRAQAQRRMLHRPAFFDAVQLFELDLMARDARTDEASTWRKRAEEAGARPGGPRRPQPRGRRRGGRGRRRGGRRGRGGGRGLDAAAGPEAGAWLPPPPPEDR